MFTYVQNPIGPLYVRASRVNNMSADGKAISNAQKQRTQRLLQQLAPSPARSEEPHSDQDMTEAVGHAWRSPPYADTAEPSAARGKQPKQEVKKGKGAKAEKRKGPSASQV